MTGSLHRLNLLPKRKKLLWISAKNKNQWRQISAQHIETLSSKITKRKEEEEEEEEEEETAMDFFCRKNPRLSAQTEKTLSEK
jgi:hypothetical protein